MRKIYVGNLSYRTTEETLQDLFGQYGRVQSAAIISDRETGRSRGFGFVEMADDAEAAAAIEALHGKEFEGRRLTVNEARPKAPRRDEGRNSYRNGGGDGW